MKNKVLVSILSVLLIPLFSPSVFSEDTVMRIEHSSVAPSDVGHIFSVDIVIENAQNVTGCQVWLTYNPTVLEYVDFEKGGFFPDDAFYGEMTFIKLSSTKKLLFFPIVTHPLSQHSGDGTIITLNFKTLAVNPSYLLNLIKGNLTIKLGTLLSGADRELFVPHIDDHGNTWVGATLLPLDESLPGVIETVNDVDYFYVDVPSRGELRLYTFFGRDVVIELQDSTGTALPADDDIKYGLEDLRLRHNVSEGIYYIKVTGATENSTENIYRLRAHFTPEFDDGNTRAEATQLDLPLSSPRVGWIEPADVDYFRVDVSGPGRLSFHTTGNLDTVIELQDKTGTVIELQDSTGAVLTSGGIYYIKVTGVLVGKSGDYTLHASFTPIRNHRPVVRLIHFIPSGKEYDLDKKHEELKKKMEHVKAFYQCEMRRHGHFSNNMKQFGKTFIFDEKAYVVHSHFPEDHWQDVGTDPDKNLFSGVWADIEAFWGGENWGDFDPTTDIYLAIMEGNYRDGVRGEGLTGKAIVYNTDWLTIAHELGHAFGLGHNFGDAKYMMSYCNHTWGWFRGGINPIPLTNCDTTWDHNPIRDIHGVFSTDHCDDFDFDGREMSEVTADWLDVHRAFNPPQVATDDPATIKIVEPANAIILRGTTTFPLVVYYADNDQPHQIQLYVPVTDAEPFAAAGSLKLHKAHTLRGGHSAWNITYSNFSDVMADRDIIKINIRTIDSYGNMTSTWHTLIKAERADIDKNGKVDAEDVAIVTEILHGREPSADYADVNGDSNVDVHDLTLVKNARESRESPPVVRLYYVYPTDGTHNHHTEQNFVKWTEEAQAFYRAEMERHGFGSKTFQFDPIVRVHKSNMTKAEIEAEDDLEFPQVMNEFFKEYIPNTDGEGDIHLFFVDVDKTKFKSFAGAAAYEHRMAYTVVKNDTASATIAHELGHNFGFMFHRKPEIANINGIDKYPIMSINCPNPPKVPGDPQCKGGLSNPIELQFLSDNSALWFDKHPLFNFLTPSTDNDETKHSFLNLDEDVKISTGTLFKFTEKDNRSDIQFKVVDSDGISIVAAWIIGNHNNVVSEYSQDGEGASEITVRVPLPKEKEHNHSLHIYIAVIDNLGNIKTFGVQSGFIWIPQDWIPPSGPAVPSLVPLLPAETTLLPNYPNPFNPETWIPYQLSEPVDVTLTIYDIKGHVVRDLDLGHQRAGMYQGRARAAHWDGKNAQGEPVASGLYFYTLKAGDFNATRKMSIRK